MTARALSALRAVLVGVAMLCVAVTLATAQPTTNMNTWEALAARAETALASEQVSNLALEQLRSEITVFRETFLTGQGANQTRVDTLLAQIAALGDPPADGAAPEAEDIAARRKELGEQLARVQAPRKAAEEAYNRADGLIREIDRTIRDRQTAEVRRLGPSPLNPTLWSPALADLGQSVGRLGDEIVGGFGSATQPALPNETIAVMALYLSIALALLVRGRTWMEWLTLRLYAGRAGHGSPAFAFVVSLAQVIVPVLGMIALREAMYASGLLGLRGQILAEMLPTLGLLFFGAMWLGARVFPRRDAIATPLPLPGRRRREGRYLFGFLGLLLCAEFLLVRLAAFDRYTEATVSVLTFPILLATGAILLRLGVILLRFSRPEGSEPSPGQFGQMARLLGRTLLVLGIVGPVLGAVGYMVAAKLLVFPMVLSLALLALLAVLRIVVRDFYALLTGKSEAEAGEALTPVLVVFTLTVCSLPLFALIWGARVTDLLELWTPFRDGYQIGGTRISPSVFITFAMVFAVGFGLTRLLQGTLRLTVLPKTRIDVGGRNAIISGIGYVGIFLAALFAITAAGIDLSSLAIVAGALSVGIGFGLQNIVSNFVSGIILLIERPISEGDWIEVGGKQGYVRDISVRSTRIETFDRTDVIVPNADFVSGMVTNWTRGNLIGRVIVPVGVAYGSDTRKVETILRDIAEAHPLVIMNPPPAILFINFGADSLNFEIRAILRDVNFSMQVKSDMNHEIAARFADAGLEIPFAQRDIWLRNPEALRAGPPDAKESEP